VGYKKQALECIAFMQCTGKKKASTAFPVQCWPPLISDVNQLT